MRNIGSTRNPFYEKNNLSIEIPHGKLYTKTVNNSEEAGGK